MAALCSNECLGSSHCDTMSSPKLVPEVLKQFVEWLSFTSGPIEEALPDGCGRIAGRRHIIASK